VPVRFIAFAGDNIGGMGGFIDCFHAHGIYSLFELCKSPYAPCLWRIENRRIRGCHRFLTPRGMRSRGKFVLDALALPAPVTNSSKWQEGTLTDLKRKIQRGQAIKNLQHR
jgi:hypothetical protein